VQSFKIFPKEKVLFDEPMRNHTTFKIGGPADVLFLPENVEDVKECIEICKRDNIPFFVIGNGSNLLVKDEGFRGVIIKIAKNMDKIYTLKCGRHYAQSGIILKTASKIFAEKSLSGFEFLDGIPGTVGGAITMNAGAYDGEIKQIVHSVDIFDIIDRRLKTLDNNEMDFAYRRSVIKKGGLIVLGASFNLTKVATPAMIKQKIDHLNEQRRAKQPLNMPSAGSTFKRPIGHFAGKLIGDAGLKGFKIGGALVSQKHAGFVVNDGNATAKDVLELIDHIKNVVQKKYNVLLEEEVVII